MEDQRHAQLDSYMGHGFHRVDGWCIPHLADVLKLLDDFQRAQTPRVVGGVAEIGIHHGRFFLMLNSLCESSETSFALDVFEEQSLNIDFSGQGSKAVFLDNLARYDRHGGQTVSVLQADSTTADIEALVTRPVRFFSIDGGHTPEHTVADLRSAQSVLHPQGVVILDDITNEHWLGVIEGAMSFLQTKPTLVPFAIGHNKLFLCNLSYAEKYTGLLRESRFMAKKAVRFMGWDLVALGVPPDQPPARSPMEDLLTRLSATEAQLSASQLEVEAVRASVQREVEALRVSTQVEVEQLRAQYSEAVNHISRLHQTVSWRTTAPLRSIRRLFS